MNKTVGGWSLATEPIETPPGSARCRTHQAMCGQVEPVQSQLRRGREVPGGEPTKPCT